MIDANTKLHSNPRCLLTELDDGTGVLLHLDTKYYFTLNDTGVFLWKQLAETPSSASELAERLSVEFEVTEGDALPHVRSLVEELHANRLIELR